MIVQRLSCVLGFSEVETLAVDEFPDLCDVAGPFESHCFASYVSEIRFFCIRARDVGIRPKILDGQRMQRISECRVIFRHCGRSYLSPALYKMVSTKIIMMLRSVF